MSVVIRLKRAGAKKRPFYKIVVADSRRQRDGRFVEMLGWYDPIAKPFQMKVDEAKVKAWIAEGAQPSEQVASLLRPMGIIAARPSKPAKPAAAKAATKKAAVRRKPRKVTERKVKAKATRAKKKAAGTNRKPRKAKKK